MILSILTPTLPQRHEKLGRLFDCLKPQLKDDVEFLGLTDTGARTTGEKRNLLLNMAKGRFITFIDDDDFVSDNYVSEVCKAIEANPDVTVFIYDLKYHDENTGVKHTARGSLRHAERFVDEDGIHCGWPLHVMVWNRDFGLRKSFPDTSFGEDSSWSRPLSRLAFEEGKSEFFIDNVFYYYQFDIKDSQSRKYELKRRAATHL